jgi:DNA (cytosine-5)-methyltransferase 1
MVPQIRDTGFPAPTVTGNVKAWRHEWPEHRPSTTVQGDPRIAAPGHRDRAGGEPQFGPESVRVTVAEAAALQAFPPGHPFQGSATKQYLQVGNAVPPLLAWHILKMFV